MTTELTTIPVGTKVRYWQPDPEGILASWAGRSGGGGEWVETTIAEVNPNSYHKYQAADGTILTASEVEVVS